jgi:hypothetical protein
MLGQDQPKGRPLPIKVLRVVAGLLGLVVGAAIALGFGAAAVFIFVSSFITGFTAECSPPQCMPGFGQFVVALGLGAIAAGGLKLIDISIGSELFDAIRDWYDDW